MSKSMPGRGRLPAVEGATAAAFLDREAAYVRAVKLQPRNPDAWVAEVMAYARDVLEPEMKAVASEAGILLEMRSSFPGLDTPPGTEIVSLAKACAGRNDHSKVAFGTEAGGFSEGGIPSVVVGPGSIDQAHKADEFIAISEIEKCGRFLDRLIGSCAA